MFQDVKHLKNELIPMGEYLVNKSLGQKVNNF
jgi:hypothetical protein